MRQQQEEQKVNFGYYGPWAVWRDRSLEDIQAQLALGRPWVLRFRSTGSLEHKFLYKDLVKGELTITENDIDQVLLKSDGIPTYHFAHAVDDHLMRTTHVVRGDEWLPSLPFHIQLFRALGFSLPKYVHIGPLMKMDGASKRKLSKRKDPGAGRSLITKPRASRTGLSMNTCDLCRTPTMRTGAEPTHCQAEDFPFSAKS